MLHRWLAGPDKDPTVRSSTVFESSFTNFSDEWNKISWSNSGEWVMNGVVCCHDQCVRLPSDSGWIHLVVHMVWIWVKHVVSFFSSLTSCSQTQTSEGSSRSYVRGNGRLQLLVRVTFTFFTLTEERNILSRTCWVSHGSTQITTWNLPTSVHVYYKV